MVRSTESKIGLSAVIEEVRRGRSLLRRQLRRSVKPHENEVKVTSEKNRVWR
jgi:hypothetical protein